MQSDQLSSGQMVGKLFKKASKEAVKQGEARLLYEDMVRVAERRLAEINRKSAAVQSAEARAEELASELFHKPGSQLTEQELARMWQQSGCSDIRKEPDCKFPSVFVFRNIDGTCNNLENPLFGASTTPFTRIIPAQYEDGMKSLRGGLQGRKSALLRVGSFVPPYPSARLISQTVIDRNLTREERPFTHVLMQWGQFLDHDMDLSPELEPQPECEHCTFTDICEPIFVPRGDPSFGEGTRQNGDCLRFARSLPACDTSRPGEFLPREQLNELTSFIDGSQVYGSNSRVGNAVRAFQGGLLKTGAPFPSMETLPVDNEDLVACPNQVKCFLAGDVRANEQISLTIMHTIWLREHNRIARKLSRINPFWNDERIFQEARRIVGAEIQKITYEDYLPKVLGPVVFNEVIGRFRAYDPRVDPGIANTFATAAYRYGHSLVQPMFERLGSNYRSIARGPLNLVNAFFNPSQFRLSLGTDPILRGLVTVNASRFDEFLNFVLTTQLFQTTSSPGMDLASLNIQRGRDHGLPPYLTWRRFCEKEFGNLFNKTGDIFENDLTLVRFLQLYGSLDTVDLWIAGLAEKRLPEAFFGPTFACIFGITFSNVRNGDRFFYENPNVFSPAQLAEIRKASLSRVICKNSDGIDSIQPDAFLSNQSRISCSLLPSINLNLWKEQQCFVRVEVKPRETPLLVGVFSRLFNNNQITSFTSKFAANTASMFQCMQVACPTSSKDMLIFASVDRQMTISQNTNLAPNQLHSNRNYQSRWPNQMFGASSGLFRSHAACGSASSVGLTFSKTGREQERLSDVQQLELALQQQNGGGAGGGGGASRGGKDGLQELKKFFMVAGSPSGGGGGTGGSVSIAAEVASDQEIASELEEALQALD